MKYDRETIDNAGWISLNKNEDVRAWSHSSIYPYIPIYVLSVLMVLAGMVLPFVFDLTSTMNLLALSLIPIGIGILVLEHIRYLTVFYVFTDDRVFRKMGVFRHKTRSVGYDSIDKIKTNQSLIGRILDFGDMTIVTATPTDKDILLTYIPDLEEANDIVGDYTGYKASRRDKETIKDNSYRNEE